MAATSLRKWKNAQNQFMGFVLNDNRHVTVQSPLYLRFILYEKISDILSQRVANVQNTRYVEATEQPQNHTLQQGANRMY